MTKNLLTPRNVFYLNILLGAILFLVTVFVVRDIISLHFEQKKNMRTIEMKGQDIAALKPDKQLAEYEEIVRNNPFGVAGGEIRSLVGSSSPKSQQGDIILIGTVVGPRALSYAIFKDASGLQEVFKIGDPVFDIGRLDRVQREKVVIRKAGKTVEILLEDVKVKEVKQTASSTGPLSSSFAQKIGRATYMVDQARLQQAIANPGQMMTDARLKPNIVNGREEGFVLSEVKPGGVYQSLGLQDGDVLLRINEYDISNPERALQAFTALKGMDRVQVDLVRSGSRMTMTYQIK